VNSLVTTEVERPQTHTDGHAVIVVFGASGDLTSRKLLPAVGLLGEHGQPPFAALIGVGRRPIADAEFAAIVSERAGAALLDDVDVRYLAGDYGDPETYQRLVTLIEELTGVESSRADRVFYLATPPVTFTTIAAGLGAAKLQATEDGAYSRILVEKPFGTDFDTAADLDRSLHRVFDEANIFRVDHYLAKEAVQNILALRFSPVISSVWDSSAVDHIQVTVAEADGVAERASFYDRTGAMRDIVQNHVLQILALLMMERPISIDPDVIRAEKLRLLKSVRVPLDRLPLADVAVRGQYAGYRNEPGVDPDSRTETYVAVLLEVDNERWAGVPVYVRTGKRLPRRVTELYVKFRPVDDHPFPPVGGTDALVLRVQPDDGISLELSVKASGEEFRLAPATMDFKFSDRDDRATDPYEQVLHDALTGNQRLFVSSDEVLESWRIVDPVVTAWADGTPDDYPAGSWGPAQADRLIGRDGRAWRPPTETGAAKRAETEADKSAETPA
jgi:glucose-6-phosphate 1-dehydrogenase